MTEDVLVDVCLYGVIEDYRTYLEDQSFFLHFFFHVNGSQEAYRQVCYFGVISSLLIKFMPKKVLMIKALKKNKGSKPSSSKKLSHGKKETNNPIKDHGKRRQQICPP